MQYTITNLNAFLIVLGFGYIINRYTIAKVKQVQIFNLLVI